RFASKIPLNPIGCGFEVSLSVHGWLKNNLIFIILPICLKVLWLCIFSSAQNMILYLSKNREKGNRQ
ncbi:hypothetical protein, partial [Parabacteroides merdae]|uniref:hypothetical protein n=1 Tax=Parabacteroides merdae TaxID=46503 RepID=UPI001C704835